MSSIKFSLFEIADEARLTLMSKDEIEPEGPVQEVIVAKLLDCVAATGS